MFYGTLNTWDKQKSLFPACFSKALEFALRTDINTLTDGKYPIDGEDIFALLQQPETEAEHLRKFELHQRYIDIQLLLAGNEKQLYAPEPSASDASAVLLEDRLADADYAFYSTPAHYNSVCMQPGDFTIYLPGELHCPNCIPELQKGGKIRKIVFKINHCI